MSDQLGLDLETIPEGYARFPGIDADGYGTHDIQRAVGQGPRTHENGRMRARDLWDPEEGFIAPKRPA
jgi:hypothetical protein